MWFAAGCRAVDRELRRTVQGHCQDLHMFSFQTPKSAQAFCSFVDIQQSIGMVSVQKLKFRSEYSGTCSRAKVDGPQC
jgi:hypothetical protein